MKDFFNLSTLHWKIFWIIISVVILLFVIILLIIGDSQILTFLIYIPILWAALLKLPIFADSNCGGAMLCFPTLNIMGWILMVLTYIFFSYLFSLMIAKIVARFKN